MPAPDRFGAGADLFSGSGERLPAVCASPVCAGFDSVCFSGATLASGCEPPDELTAPGDFVAPDPGVLIEAFEAEAAVDGAASVLVLGSEDPADDPVAVAGPIPPAAIGAVGLDSVLDTSVAFRSSRADGFFGPLPSDPSFPVVFELSFLFVMAAASLSCQREPLATLTDGSGRVKASCLTAGGLF